jgi:tetratricopeptide (TPR) repeat protein
MKAKSAAARAKHARAGLVTICDVETQGLLLRQLYVGELESGNFEQARIAAEQMIALGVLGDVAHHDAARACQAMGDYDAAVAHLEAAAELGPSDRTSFHLSTLGGLLYAVGRAEEATVPLARAVSRGEDAATPLLRGQLALAKHAAEGDEAELDYAYHELLRDPSGEGYGRFVLGELASARGDRLSARLHLEAFLAKVRRSRPAAKAALSPEVARAESTLGRIAWN